MKQLKKSQIMKTQKHKNDKYCLYHCRKHMNENEYFHKPRDVFDQFQLYFCQKHKKSDSIPYRPVSMVSAVFFYHNLREFGELGKHKRSHGFKSLTSVLISILEPGCGDQICINFTLFVMLIYAYLCLTLYS